MARRLRAGHPLPAATPSAATEGGTGVPLSVVLSRLAVEDARITMTDGMVAPPATLLAVEDADFDSSFEVKGVGAQGKGEARIEVVNLADLLFLREARAELLVSPAAVRLAPLSAKLAKGTAEADLDLRLKDFRYVMKLEVKGADVATLMAEAKTGAAPLRDPGRPFRLRGHGRHRNHEGQRTSGDHRSAASRTSRCWPCSPPSFRCRSWPTPISTGA